jgi:hypothetical protein
VAFFCNLASGGTFSSTAIEIIKWAKKIAVAQAKVTHILRPGKASEKTPKGVIPPSLCEISQNASRKKQTGMNLCVWLMYCFAFFRITDEKDTLDSEVETLRELVGRIESDNMLMTEKQTVDRDLAFELDQVRGKLERAEQANDDAFHLKTSYETLKHTWLETQDQISEYEMLVGKLEKSVEEARSTSHRVKKEASENSAQLAKMKVGKRKCVYGN